MPHFSMYAQSNRSFSKLHHLCMRLGFTGSQMHPMCLKDRPMRLKFLGYPHWHMPTICWCTADGLGVGSWLIASYM